MLGLARATAWPRTYARLACSVFEGVVVMGGRSRAFSRLLFPEPAEHLSDELEDLAVIVAGEFLDEPAVLQQQDRRHVARRVLGALQIVKVADGELGLTLELIVSECGGKFSGVAAASPLSPRALNRCESRSALFFSKENVPTR